MMQSNRQTKAEKLGPAQSLVLFDIDGTLISRSGAHHKRALVEGVRRVLNVSTSLDSIPTSGMLDRDLLTTILRTAGVSTRRILGALPAIVKEAQLAYLDSHPESLTDRVCPGVLRLLEQLRDHRACLGVVTGNLSLIGWKKLELAGLRGFFSVGAFSEHGSTRALLTRAAIRQARRERRVAKRALVSLVGDHPNDVAAAIANGIRAIATGTGLGPLAVLKAARPHLLVPDLTHLTVDDLFGPPPSAPAVDQKTDAVPSGE